jgi:Tfp pilus assembly protein PilN
METNLLPAREKKFLQAEKNLRLTTLGVIFICLAVGVASGFIWGVQQMVQTEQAGLQSELNSLQQRQQGSESSQVITQIENLNALLTFLDSQLTNRPAWTANLERLLALIPVGIKLDELTATLSDRTLVFKGIAATRDQLIQVQDILKADQAVESLDSPLSNIVQRENIPFTLTIKIKTDSLFPYRHASP